ncbi:uncharacterized protein LOC125768893 isoform X1 [Anopheles funestus]|uniref:uncharacterized protein LOC125768893 isoform X1 n=1 Tax=Anopheles funestus TaxID=62324 RepID=UPI0020C62373|nr:uncharacterized protein LOC125768893 isoform X1 [Anopheles funestus]
MELPEFNGDFKKWNHFKSVFYKTSEEAKFSDLENLNRLQKALKGDALECVSGLMLDAQNIEGILQRLEKEFGTPDLIYSALLKELLAVENPTMQKPKSFITFMHALNNLVINMNTIGEPEYLNDQRLLKDLENKIPTNLKHKWYNHILADNENYGRSKLRTLEDFAKWLKPTENLAIMLTADVANDVVNSQSHQHNQQLGHRNFRAQPRQQFQANIQSQPRRRMGCLICGQNHRTTECFQFQNMSAERRWETVRRLRICSNCCNQSNHDAQNCFLPPQCRQYGCRARHHTLLHRTTPTGLRQVENVNIHHGTDLPGLRQVENVNIHHGTDLPELYFPIIPVTLRHNNREVDTFAFMDTGSSASLIHRELKEELQVNGSPRPFSLAWTNGSIQDEPESQTISISVKDQDGRFISLDGLRTVESMVLPKQTVNGMELRRKYRHLRGIDLQSYRDGAPKLIIGLPHAHLICALQTRTGQAGGPIAIQTHLGWVLLGTNYLNSKQPKLFSLIEAKNANKDIASTMRNHVPKEDFGVKLNYKIPQPKDEKRVEIEKTIRKTETVHEIGKTEVVSIPEECGQSLRRLQSLERKLTRDGTSEKLHRKETDAYGKKDCARENDRSETIRDKFSPKANYVPNFAIVKYNKPIRKPRLVFDTGTRSKQRSLAI